VLGLVAGAFDDFVAGFGQGWGELSDQVAWTHRSLVDVEAGIEADLMGVLERRASW
jgi:hypothetical protein